MPEFFEESRDFSPTSRLSAVNPHCTVLFCFFFCMCRFFQLFIYNTSFAFSTLCSPYSFVIIVFCYIGRTLLLVFFTCVSIALSLMYIQSRIVPVLVAFLFDWAHYTRYKLKNCYNGARKKCLCEPINCSVFRKIIIGRIFLVMVNF